MNKLSLLLISNSTDIEQIIKENLQKIFKLNLYRVQSQEEYIEILTNKEINLIIMDYNNQCFNDLESFYIFKNKNINIPFIIIADGIKEEKIVEFIKKGVNNYISINNLINLNNLITLELIESNTKESLFKKKMVNILEEISKLDEKNIEELIKFTIQYSLIITESKSVYFYDYEKDRKFYLNKYNKYCEIAPPAHIYNS